MPTRIVREGILTSEPVNNLSERAELFYRRLMSVADDYGRYYSNPALLRAHCYPLRLDTISEANVKQMLSECIACGLMFTYGGGKYIQIVKFNQQTRSKSKFPEPTKDELLSNCKANDKPMLSLDGVGDGDVVEGGDGLPRPSIECAFDSIVPQELIDDRFFEAWHSWVLDRKARKKPLTIHAAGLQLKKLKDMGVEEALIAIDNAIEHGWTGLFKPKDKHEKQGSKEAYDEFGI